MAYLKKDSVPAQQELQARKACQIIHGKVTEHQYGHKKSYVIESTFEKDLFSQASNLPAPFDKPFGRG